MPTLPTSDWTQALERMTAAVKEALTEAERAQSRWGTLLEPSGSTSSPDVLLKGFQQRLNLMDSRLNAASELAATIEKQLADRQADLNHWQAVFVQWQELLKRQEERTTRYPG